MTKRLFFALLTPLLLVALSCGGGGGGGEPLTLEEYFTQLEELDQTLEDQSDELDAEFADLTDEQALERAPDLLGQQVNNIEEFVDGIEELDPPEEARDLHDEAVDTGRDVVEKLDAALTEAEDAETIDELGAAFSTEELNAAFEAFDQVCLDAEALAAENDITIDMNCEE